MKSFTFPEITTTEYVACCRNTREARAYDWAVEAKGKAESFIERTERGRRGEETEDGERRGKKKR